MSPADPPRYPFHGLHRFVAEALTRLGMPPGDAGIVATILLDADLAGVDTHGIANLPSHAHYARGLKSGAVDPTAEPIVLRDSPVAAAWDSNRAFGLLTAYRAMEAAIAKAEAVGVGMVTIRDARHFGAGGYYAEMAVHHGMIGMVASNTPPAGIPPGGTTPLVGTNPLAFAAPAGEGPPFVVDLAMTVVSGTKAMVEAAAGNPVPPGWFVGPDGNPNTDPNTLRTGGLEMVGGQLAGHKGFGLALMVDTLGILAGNGSGLWQTAFGDSWSQGQWFAAWRIDLFIDPDEFLAEMQRLVDHVQGSPARPGERVIMPGRRRADSRADRMATGVPISQKVTARLLRLAEETGAGFPAPLG